VTTTEPRLGYKVVVIESERGWGQKVDEVLYFKTRAEASSWSAKFNSRNPPGPAPDWYMQAGPPVVAELPEGVEYYQGDDE
jgi:hypothetical protein